MDDLNFSRSDQRTPTTSLSVDWLENVAFTNASPNDRMPAFNSIANGADSYLSFVSIANDKQEPVKEKAANADKEQAEKLDRELKDFAAGKIEDSSRSLQRFQKALDKFNNSSDKDAAMDDLSDTYNSLNTRMSIGAEAMIKERKEEIARQPGRKALESEYKKKQNQLSGKILDLPFEESLKVEDLLKWQEGESRAQHNERVRKGLAGNKAVLDAFNEVEAARDNIESSKSQREKHLDHLINQIDSESRIIQEQVEKAYIRSTLKN
ncbi:MAG: hypothetical protein K2X27_21080 [Candidatus Obscuribacterales bacterium]|nr:hypothetical protein [Candidatus Obscuribacterales bacterium]